MTESEVNSNTTTTVMMSTGVRKPPIFLESKSYEVWKKEVQLWKICCRIDKKEQGPALALSLTGSAREAALELEVTELNSDDGVDKLITKLDGLFLKDENQRIYISLKKFEQYKRTSTQSIDDFINQFELLHNKIKAYKIDLPDPVVAYRLLESANLPANKSELIRTTISKLNYKLMKSQLRKLEDSAVRTQENVDLDIKEEPSDTFFNRGYRRGRGRDRGSFGSWKRGNYSRGGGTGRGRGACFVCKSVNHWANDCPQKNDVKEDFRREDRYENDTEDIKIVL